jgi:spermidine/putrescine transport system permease protein
VTNASHSARRGRISASLGRLVPMVPIYVWLILLIVSPNLLLVIASVWKNDGGVMIRELTLVNYGKVLDSSTYRLLIVRTLYTALGAALLAALIAYPMAYFASLKLRRHKMMAVLLVVIPLWVSLLIRVFAWRMILGENGVLNSFLVDVGILDEPSEAFLYTRFTVFLTFTYVAIPYVFITAYTALERVPRNLIEASHDCGAGRWRTIAFLIAVADYVTPSMVGGLDGTMVGMVIASQFGLAGNWPLGAAMAITLLFFVILFIALIARLAMVKGRLEATPGMTIPASTRRLRTFPEHVRHIGSWALFALPYLFLYTPLAAVAIFSFNDSKIPSLPFVGFTLTWYDALFADAEIGAALWRSELVAGSAVAIALTAGTSFALVFAGRRRRAAGVLLGGLSLPVALPGIVLGVSLVIAFQIFAIGPGVHRVIVGHLTFVMPIVMLIVLSRLRLLDPSYVEASMDLGANRLRTFIHVVFPMISSALIGAALLGFTLSFDEIIVTFFLTGVQPTLPVYVWNQLRFGFTPSVNAIFTCIGVASFVIVVIATRILRREVGARERAALPASA